MEIKSKEIKLVKLDTIQEWSKNRNIHTEEQIDRLCELIKYNGFRNPLVVDIITKDIIAGNGRYRAAKKLKLEYVPIIEQEFESEEQKYAYMVSDNAIAKDSWAELDFSGINSDIGELGPDFNIDLLGIKDFVLEPLEKLEAGCDEDEVPEVKETTAKLGDLFELGEHRLICADSTDILQVERLMSGQKADMVFTDPPYGINEETDRVFSSLTRKTSGNSFDKIIGDDSTYTALSAYSILNNLSDIICYWGGNYYANKLLPSPCWIVWDKRVDDIQRDMNSDCELAYVKHPQKKSVRIFRHKWKGMIKDSENGQRRIHPTQKPIALAEWSFNELNETGKSVLDLFGGSGSTLIACEKTNRKCFMSELDPHYVDVIIQRWQKFSNKKAYLINQDGSKTLYDELKSKNEGLL